MDKPTVTVEAIFGPMVCFSDDLVTRHLLRHGAHARNELAMLLRFVEDGDFVYDIGAHIGTFAIPLAGAVGRNGRVIAVEANGNTHALLAQNLESRGLPSASAVHAALGDGAAPVVAHSFEGNSGATYFVPAGHSEPDAQALRRLDDLHAGLAGTRRVDLVKVDVEGMELSVLRSARGLLTRDRPILYVEISDEQLRRHGDTPADVEHLLEEYGYRFFRNVGDRNSSHDRYTLRALGRLADGGAFFDLLAIPDGHPRFAIADAAARESQRIAINAASPSQQPAVKSRRSLEELLATGKAARRDGRRSDALQAFLDALKLAPKHVFARVDAAIELRDLGRLDESEAMLAPLLPANMHARMQLGFLKRKRGDLGGAAETFAAVARDHPDHLPALINAARDLVACGELDTAASFLTEVLKREPSHAEAIVLQAQSLEARGRLLDAIAMLEPLIRGGKADFSAQSHYIAMATRAGMGEQATAAIAAITVSTAPQFVRVLVMRGILARHQFDYGVSIRHFREALRHAPANVNAMLNLAEDLIVTGQVGEAQAYLDQAGSGPERASLPAADGVRIALLRSFANVASEPEQACRDLAAAGNAGLERFAILARRHSPHCHTHLAVLRALMVQGALATEARGGDSAIPKVIAQYWHDASPPPDVAACMQSWRGLHDFAYRLFDDASARDYIGDHADKLAREAYDLCTHPAMKSDLFRLCFAVREGGFYADADEVLVGSPDQALSCADLLLIQERHGAIWNGFFGAAAGHPVTAAALARAVDNIIARRPGNIWSISGPGVWSQALSCFALEHPDALRRVTVLPRSSSRAWCGTALHLKYKRTVQNWHLALGETP